MNKEIPRHWIKWRKQPHVLPDQSSIDPENLRRLTDVGRALRKGGREALEKLAEDLRGEPKSIDPEDYIQGELFEKPPEELD